MCRHRISISHPAVKMFPFLPHVGGIRGGLVKYQDLNTVTRLFHHSRPWLSVEAMCKAVMRHSCPFKLGWYWHRPMVGERDNTSPTSAWNTKEPIPPPGVCRGQVGNNLDFCSHLPALKWTHPFPCYRTVRGSQLKQVNKIHSFTT